MTDYTIGSEKHKETIEIEPIGGQNNFAQELSNLADQRSRFDRHIIIGSDRQRLSEVTI